MRLPTFLLLAILACGARAAEPAAPGAVIAQAPDRSITLPAHAATVHGSTLRYETAPEKNTLGYWTKAEDWASWTFEVAKPGEFIVFAMHGSPGGSEVDLAVGDQVLHWTTAATGSFHTFTFLEVGRLKLDAGRATLSVKPTKKAGAAIMDLRQVILVPVLD